MSKPKKLNFNGESKVIKYLTTCINWLLDNHTKANPTDEATETLSKIEIDGAVYKIEGGGSPTPSNPQIIKVYDDTTSGSSTYTVIQDGLYLIINSYSAYSTHSITLPQNRIPIVSGDVGIDRGMSWNVVELQTGDVITIETIPSDWVAFSKVIYRLEDIIVKSLANSVGVDDSTATLTPPTGTFLMVGVSMGRTSSDYVNNTVTTGHDCLTVEGEVGVNTTIGTYYGNDLPEGNFYGYDGGGGYIALFLAQSGGGTNIVPNPQEAPTDTLSTIKINNTVYDLATTAEKTSYDNTNSNLTADNVQDAIDELVQPFKFEVDPTDTGINIVYDDSTLNGGE